MQLSGWPQHDHWLQSASVISASGISSLQTDDEP